MDIEEFYEADPARRSSEEFGYGRDWTDPDGGRCEMLWIQATGELYTMREPTEPILADPFGDTVVPSVPSNLLIVEVLAEVKTRAEVDQLLEGWETAMTAPGSLAWVRDRLAKAPRTGQ
jgi:hypothetical protein